MIKHVVMWKLKEEAEGKTALENMEWIRDHLYALDGVISQLRSIQIGFDVTHAAGSYDLVLITEFDNTTDMKTYNDHPEHQKVVQFIRKVVDSRIACDFEE